MPFGVPMVWRVPSNHCTDGYFRMMLPIQNGMSMKKKSTLVYPNIPSEIRPVPHGNGLPVPEPLDNFAMYSDDEDGVFSNSEVNISHQLQELQTTCPAQNSPIIRSQKASSITSSGISNFQKEGRTFGINFTTAEFTTPLPHYILNWGLKRIL